MVKTFQICNPPDFQFYFGKSKNSPYSVILILSLFSLQKKKKGKFNITPYGDKFYYLTYWNKIKNLEGYIF